MIAMVASVIVIPTDPMSSRGFRPNRSTVAMAMNVVRTLIVAPITVVIKASSSVNPTASQRRFE